jgi:hypothetical protein
MRTNPLLESIDPDSGAVHIQLTPAESAAALLPSPPAIQFLQEVGLGNYANEIDERALAAILNRGCGRVIQWLTLVDFIVKFTEFLVLDARGIQHAEIPQYENRCIALIAWLKARTWVKGKALPFRSEKMLRRIYGIDAFYEAGEIVVTRVWALLLLSFWGNDLYFYFNPEPYLPPSSLTNIFFTQSANEQALVSSLSRPDHWYIAVIFFGLLLCYGIFKAWQAKQSAKSLRTQDLLHLEQVLNNYYPGFCADILSWVLPYNTMRNVFDAARRCLLWDNRLSNQQRLDLFEAFLSCAKRAEKITQWNALEVLSDLANGIALADFKKLHALGLNAETIESFLIIKTKSWPALQQSRAYPNENEKNCYKRVCKPLPVYVLKYFFLWCLGQEAIPKTLQLLF